MNEPDGGGARRDELAGNLSRLRARIERACVRAHRSASDLTLIAVTKTFPAEDVALLCELGVADVGENRDREAAAKVAELTARWGQPAQDLLRWHFIGALQTNKARSVAGYAHMVHSVDRLRLVKALAAVAQARARPLRCLVQVNLDDRPVPGRAGAAPDDVCSLADALAATPGLLLAGVMGVAPLGGDAAAAFALLAEVAERVRGDHPDATVISAGMTGDLEEAVDHGATHLRVGAAILGSRRHAG